MSATKLCSSNYKPLSKFQFVEPVRVKPQEIEETKQEVKIRKPVEITIKCEDMEFKILKTDLLQAKFSLLADYVRNLKDDNLKVENRDP